VKFCLLIWQLYNPERMPAADDQSFPFERLRGTTHWRKAMDFEGAFSMGPMRKLFELRPWYKMVPDQSVIASGQGEGEDHVQAARASDGSFIVAYLPFGNPIKVQMDKISGKKVKAQWYDPRKGSWASIGEYPNTGAREFSAPSKGKQSDWVLVLEDASKNYPIKSKEK
jgi:Putative collagen-binding domain of a collagenase